MGNNDGIEEAVCECPNCDIGFARELSECPACGHWTINSPEYNEKKRQAMMEELHKMGLED